MKESNLTSLTIGSNNDSVGFADRYKISYTQVKLAFLVLLPVAFVVTLMELHFAGQLKHLDFILASFILILIVLTWLASFLDKTMWVLFIFTATDILSIASTRHFYPHPSTCVGAIVAVLAMLQHNILVKPNAPFEPGNKSFEARLYKHARTNFFLLALVYFVTGFLDTYFDWDHQFSSRFLIVTISFMTISLLGFQGAYNHQEYLTLISSCLLIFASLVRFWTKSHKDASTYFGIVLIFLGLIQFSIILRQRKKQKTTPQDLA